MNSKKIVLQLEYKKQSGDEMARKARAVEAYGIYYIKQRGNAVDALFRSTEDRIKFLDILSKTRLKFGYKLYAYCLKNENTYHLIINANGSDLSKIMKSINIAFAMFRKCEGKLFKDRYKSERIENTEKLKSIMANLHCEEEETQFNSFCAYKNHQEAIMDIEPLEFLLNPEAFKGKGASSTEPECQVDVLCKNCIETFEDAERKLNSMLNEKDLDRVSLLKDKALRNKWICYFRKNSLLSLKDLGILFGGLSESTVCKILNQDH